MHKRRNNTCSICNQPATRQSRNGAPLCYACFINLADEQDGLPEAPYPCVFAPGSRAKVEALRWRYLNGFKLFRNDDYKGE